MYICIHIYIYTHTHTSIHPSIHPSIHMHLFGQHGASEGAGERAEGGSGQARITHSTRSNARPRHPFWRSYAHSRPKRPHGPHVQRTEICRARPSSVSTCPYKRLRERSMRARKDRRRVLPHAPCAGVQQSWCTSTGTVKRAHPTAAETEERTCRDVDSVPPSAGTRLRAHGLQHASKQAKHARGHPGGDIQQPRRGPRHLFELGHSAGTFGAFSRHGAGPGICSNAWGRSRQKATGGVWGAYTIDWTRSRTSSTAATMSASMAPALSSPRSIAAKCRNLRATARGF